MTATSTIDLHTHTTASDGTLTPEEVVRAAVAQGLDVLAVTDHDSVAGVLPAIATAAGTRLRVVPGLELSAWHGGRSLHLLGYGFDPANRDLIEQLDSLARGRAERARRILEKLSDLGAPLDYEQVAAYARGTVGRPHIARALVAAGYARDVSDAFERFIGGGKPAYVPSARLSVAGTVELVSAAGGVVGLAHPLLPEKPLDVETLLPELKDAGLTGVEVYYSEHDAAATARLRQLADREGLWWSGGSDFHGLTKPHISLGCAPFPADTRGSILDYLDK